MGRREGEDVWGTAATTDHGHGVDSEVVQNGRQIIRVLDEAAAGQASRRTEAGPLGGDCTKVPRGPR
jgi:hypothetical protein